MLQSYIRKGGCVTMEIPLPQCDVHFNHGCVFSTNGRRVGSDVKYWRRCLRLSDAKSCIRRKADEQRATAQRGSKYAFVVTATLQVPKDGDVGLFMFFIPVNYSMVGEAARHNP